MKARIRAAMRSHHIWLFLAMVYLGAGVLTGFGKGWGTVALTDLGLALMGFGLWWAFSPDDEEED